MPQMPYAGSRQPIYASGGMVATSQPLATQAGLFVLREGGNAVDAAIATAAALTVVEPTSNGIGGDAFALVWMDGQLSGINGSGAAPAGLSLEALHAAGLAQLPSSGWWPVTVPGAPRTWADLHARFGKLPFGRLLEPAIRYARQGYPLSPVLARGWKRAAEIYPRRRGPEYAGWAPTFLPEGFEPRAGALWASEGHARTLEAIAKSQADDFYSGGLAEQILRFAEETGGLLRAGDLAGHRSEWVDPICTEYRGHQVWELPPNGQGLVALEALGILNGLTLPGVREQVEGLHLQIEAIKLAFADGLAHIADPRQVEVPTERLLSRAHLEQRRGQIGELAGEPTRGRPGPGGTVYLATADGQGGMVSLIQSNYQGFGSGVVIPGTGIALQNRGHNFSCDPAHPNALAPGKRPYHTIIPGFLTRAGQPVGPFGVMGGFMQPQGHLQVLVNTLDYGMDPQQALDAPRWQWTGGREVQLEMAFGQHLALALQDLGHQVLVTAQSGGFGRGQIIWRQGKALVAGSEGRTDGQAAGY